MISVEIFNNEFKNLKFDFDTFNNIKILLKEKTNIPIKYQIWMNKNKLVEDIKNNNKYIVFSKNDYVNIKVTNNNNNIIHLPQISLSTKIKDIKNIFKFNNLYYKNIKLKLESSLGENKIKNNSILNTTN